MRGWGSTIPPPSRRAGAPNARRVLLGEDSLVVSKWPPATVALLGPRSLVNNTGVVHGRLRSMMQAAFTPRAAMSHLPDIVAATSAALAAWAGRGQLPAHGAVNTLALHMALQIIAGRDTPLTRPDSFDHVEHLVHTWLAGLFAWPLALLWTRFGKAKAAHAQLVKVTGPSTDPASGCACRGWDWESTDWPTLAGSLPQRRTIAMSPSPARLQLVLETAGGELEPGTVLAHMLASRDKGGEAYSDAELADNVMTLLFAGHDTSATAMICILEELRKHPAMFAAVREEQVWACAFRFGGRGCRGSIHARPPAKQSLHQSSAALPAPRPSLEMPLPILPAGCSHRHARPSHHAGGPGGHAAGRGLGQGSHAPHARRPCGAAHGAGGL